VRFVGSYYIGMSHTLSCRKDAEQSFLLYIMQFSKINSSFYINWLLMLTVVPCILTYSILYYFKKCTIILL